MSEYANDEKNEKQHQTSSHYKSSSKRDYSATDPYSGDEDEGVDNELDQFSLDGDDSTDPRGRSNHSHGGVNNPDEIRHHEADDGYNSWGNGLYKTPIENHKYVKVHCVKMYIKCLPKVVKLMFYELKGNMTGWTFKSLLYSKTPTAIDWILFNQEL